MKIVIDGREYPAVGHKGARLLHLIELREQTRKLLAEPLGMARLDRLAKTSQSAREELDAAKALGDPDAVAAAEERVAADAELWTAVVIFLSRRGAGERVTFAEAVDVDLATVEFILEDGDRDGDEPAGPSEAPDPTPPGSGGPETSGDAANPRALKGKPKTRKGGRSTT